MIGLELQLGLCRDFYLRASGQDLSAGAGGATREGSNSSSFAATRNGSDQGSGQRAAAYVFPCALVRAKPGFPALLRGLACIQKVAMAVDGDRTQAKGDFVCFTAFGDRHLGRRALGYGNVPILVLHILAHGCGKCFPDRARIGLNCLVCADLNLAPGSNHGLRQKR